MGFFGLVLLALAVLVVVGAEWPHLARRFGHDRRGERARARRKSRLTVVHGRPERDDFAESVERDLANLPVVEEPDRRR